LVVVPGEARSAEVLARAVQSELRASAKLEERCVPVGEKGLDATERALIPVVEERFALAAARERLSLLVERVQAFPPHCGLARVLC
jgi:hypothetical protein